MEKSIKGTKTEQNLLKAFAGESQSKKRYVYFASVARRGALKNRRRFSRDSQQEKETPKGFLSSLKVEWLRLQQHIPPNNRYYKRQSC